MSFIIKHAQHLLFLLIFFIASAAESTASLSTLAADYSRKIERLAPERAFSLMEYNPDLEVHLDWDQVGFLKPADLHLPTGFLFGTATSATQIEHDNGKSDWSSWPSSNRKCSHSIGKACDGYNRLFDDIKLLQELGVQMYRFGVDWAKIEPEEGMFDEEVLAHYKRYCQALVNAGIVPMITIHHFASPSWFAAKGGFTKRENNEYLVRFARKLFTTIGTLVPFWATINEPGILAYSTFGLGRGVFPPGGMDVKKQGEMLLNLLLAHNQIYKTLKALPGGDKVQIGIVHSVVLFEPFEKTGFVGGYQASLARMMQQNVTDAVTNFFSTGEFYVYGMGPAWQPFGGSVRYSCPEARRCNDFVGLNYYTHVLMFDINGFKEKYRPWELRSEMPYALYAEGLYRAIKKIAAIGKPIYITENGFADRHDIRRRECIMRTLWVLQNAIARGYNVRGYLYWSLMDNFEWDLGYNQFFGLYSVDPVTFVRTPRKSAFMYKEIIARHKSLGADALIGTGQHKNILPSGA